MAHQTPKAPGAEGSGRMIDLPGASRAYLCTPQVRARSAVIVLHEAWGLNHHSKAQAEKLAGQGYLALAVDLYGGKVARDLLEAGRMMQAVQPDAALAVVEGAVKWLKSDPDLRVAKIGTAGWCLGGAWSLKAAVRFGRDVSACVVYYGAVPADPAKLDGLTAPVLGIFALKDKSITPTITAAFEKAVKAAGKSLQKVDFAVDHAFANPSSPTHDQVAARAAWDTTLSFFAQHLK